MSDAAPAGPVEGRCLCGAVRVRVDAAPDGVGACHCRMCQRWSGGVFLCVAAPADAVTVEGEVIRHASSEFAERAFCPVCGSHLWMRDTEEAGAGYALMPGLFDAAADWPLTSEIYCDRALASARLAGEPRRETAAEWEAENSHVEGDAT